MSRKTNNTTLDIFGLVKKGDVILVQEMLDAGDDANSVNANADSILSLAIRTNNLQMVKLICSYKADLELTNGDNWTPLMEACGRNYIQITEYLISIGAKIENHKQRFSPIHVAAESGHLDVIKILLRSGAGIDKKISFGYTPLIEAIENHKADTAIFLIKCGAKVNVLVRKPQYERFTALSLAISIGLHDVIKTLLEHKVDVNARYEYITGTPLMQVVRSQHLGLNTIMLMVDHGADVNAITRTGKNVLQIAIEENKPDIVSYLSSKQSCIKDNDKNGPLLMLYAMHSENEKLKEVILNGVNVNYQDQTGRSSLMLAAKCKNLETINILINSGIDVNLQDNSGRTALMHGLNTDITTVNALLRAKQDLNLESNDAKSALYYFINMKKITCAWEILEAGAEADDNSLWAAVLASEEELVEELVNRGADVNCRSEYGTSLLGMAKQLAKNKKLIQFLINNGAVDAPDLNWFGNLENLLSILNKNNNHQDVFNTIVSDKAWQSGSSERICQWRDRAFKSILNHVMENIDGSKTESEKHCSMLSNLLIEFLNYDQEHFIELFGGYGIISYTPPIVILYLAEHGDERLLKSILDYVIIEYVIKYNEFDLPDYMYSDNYRKCTFKIPGAVLKRNPSLVTEYFGDYKVLSNIIMFVNESNIDEVLPLITPPLAKSKRLRDALLNALQNNVSKEKIKTLSICYDKYKSIRNIATAAFEN